MADVANIAQPEPVELPGVPKGMDKQAHLLKPPSWCLFSAERAVGAEAWSLAMGHGGIWLANRLCTGYRTQRSVTNWSWP